MSGMWSELLESHGPTAASDAIISCIRAEVLLEAAVSEAGLDWCIEKLARMKSEQPNNFLETVLNSLAGSAK